MKILIIIIFYVLSSYKNCDGNKTLTRNVLENEPLALFFNNTEENHTQDVFFYENSTYSSTDVTLSTTELVMMEVTTISYVNTSDSERDDVGPSEMPSGDDEQSKNERPENCFCDTTVGMCDVNCCCDIECNINDLKTFTQCIERKNVPVDRKYCYQTLYYYSNNTKYKIINEDSLFCIVRSNLPKRVDVTEYKIATTVTEMDFNTLMLYKWSVRDRMKSKSVTELTSVEWNSKGYAYGDVVWTYYNNTFTPLDIPWPTFHKYCDKRKLLVYLKNINVDCLVKMSELEMFNVYYSLINSTIVDSTLNLTENSTVTMNKTSSNHNTSFIKFNISVCDEYACKPFDTNTDTPYCDDFKCNNMATRLQYIFYCNATKLVKASVYMHVESCNADTAFFQQHLQVKFIMIKENNSNIFESSGNPGYNIGKPIIIYQISKDKNDLDSTNIFDNNTYPLRNYLALPKNMKGLCVFNNLTHEKIEFGRSYQSLCEFKAKVNGFNATIACGNVQKDLNKIMGLRLEEKLFVMPYGDPKFDKQIKRIPLLYDISDGNIDGYIIDKELFCENLASEISYEFIYAHTSDGNMILGVVGKVRRLRYSVNVATLTVRSSTHFTLSSHDKKFHSLISPSLHIRLPSDFFYPISSHASRYAMEPLFFFVFITLGSIEVVVQHN